MQPQGSTEIDARTVNYLLTKMRKGIGKRLPGFQCLGEILEGGCRYGCISREQKFPECFRSLMPKMRCTQEKQ